MGKIVGSVVFPGLGHLLCGRYLKGALRGMLFAVTLEALVLGMVWPEALAGMDAYVGGLALVIWGYSLLDHSLLLRRARQRQAGGQGEQILLAGQKAMLRGELGQAEEAFRTVLALDDRDVEGWLYLGRTCQLQGKTGLARRFYRVVRRLDRAGKWTWELENLSGGHSVVTP